MHPLELLERRIDAVMTARDYCKPGSWGDNYWSGVLAHLLKQLNRYTNQQDISVSDETTKNLH